MKTNVKRDKAFLWTRWRPESLLAKEPEPSATWRQLLGEFSFNVCLCELLRRSHKQRSHWGSCLLEELQRGVHLGLVTLFFFYYYESCCAEAYSAAFILMSAVGGSVGVGGSGGGLCNSVLHNTICMAFTLSLSLSLSASDVAERAQRRGRRVWKAAGVNEGDQERRAPRRKITPHYGSVSNNASDED